MIVGDEAARVADNLHDLRAHEAMSASVPFVPAPLNALRTFPNIIKLWNVLVPLSLTKCTAWLMNASPNVTTAIVASAREGIYP